MANQRQREARKRFRAANPNLFPPPEPPRDPSSKKKRKKKKVLGVRKSQTKGVGAGGKRSSFGKHPLRVPGMKPGDSCFICRSAEHIAKHCPKKSEWEKNKICLLCRRRGHSLKNCPEKTETDDKKHCYNCGETGHSLSKCPKPLQDDMIWLELIRRDMIYLQLNEDMAHTELNGKEGSMWPTPTWLGLKPRCWRHEICKLFHMQRARPFEQGLPKKCSWNLSQGWLLQNVWCSHSFG